MCNFMRPCGFMPPGRFCVLMGLLRVRLARSHSPVPLPAAFVSVTRQPTTETEVNIDPTENTIEEDQIITSADELCAELFNEVATDVFQEAKREHFYPDADDDEIAEIRRRWQPYLDLLPEYRSSCRAFHTAE